MACRKAAYRAMTEMSEWMEKRQEEAAKKMAAVEEEQRKIWTPNEVFDQCCTQWLADGNEILGLQPGQASKGCNGGCGKAHPRITLDFQNGQTLATLSHELDPFLKHFDDLCAQGLARRNNASNYELTGFIPTHHEKLKQSITIGSHLVKVSTQALASSKRAQERRMEHIELEQKAKRRKVQGAAANSDLLDQVLEICYNYNLYEHLDLVDIAWMRLSCKIMAKYAARMATSRFRDIRLSYSMLKGGEDCLLPPTGHREQENVVLFSQGVNSIIGKDYEEVTVSHAPLSLTGPPDRFGPENDVDMKWSALAETRTVHLVRIYLEGAQTNAVIKKLPERDLMFSSPLEVARYEFDCGGLQNAVPATTSSSVFGIGCSPGRTPNGDILWDTVYFRFYYVDFTFRDLLGVYARKKFRHEKQKMQKMKHKTNAIKDYVRALAKEARAAPGNENDFAYMTGW